MFIIFCSALVFGDSEVVLGDKKTFIYPLKTEYLVDKGGKLSFEEAHKSDKSAFAHAQGGAVNVDHKDAVWFRLFFKSDLPMDARWILYHNVIPTDKVDFFCVRSSGAVEKFSTGDLVHISKKQVPSRNSALFFELKKDEKIEIFARVQNQGRVTADFAITSASAFVEKGGEANLIWGLLFGFLISVIFYNFWLFVTLKERLYGVYVLNASSMSLLMAIVYGFIQPLFGASALIYVDISARLFAIFSSITFILFLTLFFDMKKKFKKMHRILMIAIGLSLPLCAIFVADMFATSVDKSHTIAVFALSVCYAFLFLYVSIFMIIKKELGAFYIFLASAASAAWALLLTASFSGFVDEGDFIEKAGLVKNIIQASVLSMVLGLRFSKIKIDKAINEKLFIEQSKRAQIGDIIANVSHQWKQPLTELNAVILTLYAKASKKESLESGEIKDELKIAQDTLLRMSNTVDFFQNFFGVTRRMDIVDISDVIRNGATLFENNFGAAKIELKLQKGVFVNIEENGFLQVLLAILQNSKEAFAKANIKNQTINIISQKNEKGVLIEISDNGGGCKNCDLEKIFDQFYGDKQTSTGAGLYLSKTIVENMFGGKIWAKNMGDGLSLYILLPIVDV